jgi:endonuclease YncB( thermonuclease family)
MTFPKFLAAALVVLVPGLTVPGHSAVSATVEVIDGDTLQIGKDVIQLDGIDAPELGQICQNGSSFYSCGLDAAAALRKLVGVTTPTCSFRTGDTVPKSGVCAVGSRDLALLMVQQGYAVAVPGGNPAYATTQAEAKNTSLGIWRGDFVPFGDWRAGKRLTVEADAGRDKVCLIRGVTDEAGRRLYIVPNDPDHAKPDRQSGSDERVFCSDEEARAAGYERPDPAS